jgi:hypothetical protein
MPNALRKDIQTVITEEHLEIDSLLQLMRPSSEPFDELLDAFEIAGKFTLITTRDLALIFKGVQTFQEIVPEARKTVLAAPLAGLAAPKVVNDNQFLPLRVVASEYTSEDFDLRPTQPYDELIDLLNLVNFCEFEYDTPTDLSNQMRKMCSVFISPVLEQKLTPELLVETSQVQSNVIENHIFLKKFSEQLCSALFSARNETNRIKCQLASLSVILARHMIVPTLREKYPLDFMLKDSRFFESVGRRTSRLGLLAENERLLKKTLFLDFLDEVEFKKVSGHKYHKIFAHFCQANSRVAQELSVQRRRILSRAAATFQWVRCGHPVSYNLYVALRALHPLTIFEEHAVTLAIAMSGNPEVAVFMDLADSFLTDARVAEVIMNEHERELVYYLRKAMITLGKSEIVTFPMLRIDGLNDPSSPAPPPRPGNIGGSKSS